MSQVQRFIPDGTTVTELIVLMEEEGIPHKAEILTQIDEAVGTGETFLTWDEDKS